MQFYINKENILQNVDRMSDVISVIDDIKRQVDDISYDLSQCGLANMSKLLDKHCDDLQTVIKGVGKAAQIINIIIKLYNMAENNIIESIFNAFYTDDINKMNLSYDIDEYLYEDLEGSVRIDLSEMSDEEIREFIEKYEKQHPEYAQNINQCLQPLIDEGYYSDYQNIKAIAYSAPEPYRSFFLQNCADITIIDIFYSEGNPHYYQNQGIKFNINNFKGNYQIFFHECAHMIDDNLQSENGSYSTCFIGKNNMTLHDALINDCRTIITDNTIKYLDGKDYDIVEKVIVSNRIAELFMDCTDCRKYEPAFNDIVVNGRVIMTAEDLQTVYTCVKKTTRDEIHYASSDIYGGLTGNLLATDRLHPAEYWLCTTNDSDFNQFDNKKPEYSSNIEKEFFAENLAAHLTGNEIEGVENMFPYSDTIFEDMILGR